MREENDATSPVGMMGVLTLVFWLVPLAVGVAGLILRYPVAEAPPSPLAVPPTRIITAEIAKPMPKPVAVPPAPAEAAAAAPTPVASVPVAPSAPSLAFVDPAPVVSAAPARAEAVKVVTAKGGARFSVASGDASSRPAQGGSSRVAAARPAATVRSGPVVKRLILGEGEGNQPAPEYPREAAMAHQEGTVGLRFTVDATGRVTDVKVISPCRFGLLNRAASRVVRERWRFPPGPPRIYEVPIQFQLSQ